jgi:RNA polymerase sigma-70 factor (ECF subfamily)
MNAIASQSPNVGSPSLSPSAAERRGQFEREVMAQLDALYAFALKLAHARHDAEDLVSDTILRAIERWEQYQLATNVRAWLFTILYRLFINRRRRLSSHEASLDDERGRARIEPVGDTDPEGTFYDSFIDEEITRAIDALPRHYRLAVILSDVHGCTYAEIAEILAVPEGTAKSRLFRGRRLLQKSLVDYAVEFGYLKRGDRRVA